MICPPCRTQSHESCPEVARQRDLTLSAIDRSASQRCDCGHGGGWTPFANPVRAAAEERIRSAPWFRSLFGLN